MVTSDPFNRRDIVRAVTCKSSSEIGGIRKLLIYFIRIEINNTFHKLERSLHRQEMLVFLYSTLDCIGQTTHSPIHQVVLSSLKENLLEASALSETLHELLQSLLHHRSEQIIDKPRLTQMKQMRLSPTNSNQYFPFLI